MTLSDKIDLFSTVGDFLMQFENNTQRDDVPGKQFYEALQNVVHTSQSYNGWYTPQQVQFALVSWGKLLTKDNLTHWTKSYQQAHEPKTIGLVLAGNIPLVGFHDFLCVVFSGHKAVVKLSSNDMKILPLLAEYLQWLAPEIKPYISFTDGKLTHFDAVIATGSNNTARYFNYYFQHKPSIIRKNRHSVAVLSGKETTEELEALGEDIFRYFGLGCRNVSKIFVPKNYNFTQFFEAIYSFKSLIDERKYMNNYDYNKAVFLMSNFAILDNGFLTLKEDPSYSSPIASLFYEYYDTIEQIQEKLTQDEDQLQCIVSAGFITNSLVFGSTQKPALWDYADQVDTMQFLTCL